MDFAISTQVKNIFLAAIDDSYALTNLMVIIFMQFYEGQEENAFEYFQKQATGLVKSASSTYASKKVAQLVQAIEENFSQSEEKEDLCIAYSNLYADIYNSSWHYHTKTARMNHLREYFIAELEGWE